MSLAGFATAARGRVLLSSSGAARRGAALINYLTIAREALSHLLWSRV